MSNPDSKPKGPANKSLRILLVVAILSMMVVGAFLFVPSGDTSAQPYYDFEDGDFKYKIIDGSIEVPNQVTVIGCTQKGDVVIPESVVHDGTTYIVTALGVSNYAPFGDKVTSVKLNDNIRVINPDAFTGATNMVSITGCTNVTVVGDRAFKSCAHLTSIDLPNAQAIHSNAFEGCSSLKTISVPNVREIFLEAFIGCEALTNITLGDSLTFIATKAFYDCTSLERISIPDSLTEIRTQAFDGCTSLKQIEIGKDSKLVKIGIAAFQYCSSLREVVIPDSVEVLDTMCFAYCESLSKVTVGPGSKLTTIADGAFYGNSFDHFTVPKSVTDLSPAAFYRCMNLKSIDVEEGNTKYLSIKGVLYSIGADTDDLTLFLFPINKRVIEYTIPNSVSAIESYSFADNLHLEKVVLNSRITILPNHVFSTCPNLEEVVFVSGLKEIGPMAFWGSSALKEVTLPDSVEVISEQAFMRCFGLEAIHLGTGVVSIGKNAFKSCTSLKEFTIPDGVTILPEHAISDCTALKVLNIGSGLTSLGMRAFNSLTALKTINLSEDNTAFTMYGGALYTADFATLCLYPAMSTATEYVFHEDTLKLTFDAFWGCKYLKKVTLSKSLTTIGSDQKNPPFAFCSALERIDVPEENTSFRSVDGVLIGVRFDETCIIQCPMNKVGNVLDMRVDQFDDVESIAVGAFHGNVNLMKIFMPSNLVSFDGTITGCNALREIIFPDSDVLMFNTKIADGCPMLMHVYVPFVINSGYFKIEGYTLDFYSDSIYSKKFDDYNRLIGDIYLYKTGKEYVVTMDANGGILRYDTMKVTYGKAYGDMEVPFREGYRFIGWFTEAVGGERVYVSTIVSLMEDHTLYAHWEKAEPAPPDDVVEEGPSGTSLVIVLGSIVVISTAIVLILRRYGL